MRRGEIKRGKTRARARGGGGWWCMEFLTWVILNDPCHFLEACLTFLLNDENVYNTAVKTDFFI